MEGLTPSQRELLAGFDVLKLMVYEPVYGADPLVLALAGEGRQESPVQLGPAGVAAVLTAAMVAIMPDEHLQVVVRSAQELWEKLQANDLMGAVAQIRRVGVIMGRPWRLHTVFPNLLPQIQDVLRPLIDSSDPITRVAVDPADNGLLIHLRRTRLSISPATFVARAILSQNALRGRFSGAPGFDPDLLTLSQQIQGIAEKVFGLLAAFLLDARMVIFVGPSGCGKTLMQALLLRYVAERWPEVVRHVVVLDAHPELYGLIQRIMPQDCIVSYRIVDPDKIQEIGLVLNTTSPNVLVLQEANSLSEGAMEGAARAALTSGIPVTLTTYAEMPAVLTEANAVEVAYGAVPVIMARLGGAAGGLTPTLCVVYPAAPWIWQIHLSPNGAVGVSSLTKIETMEFASLGKLEVPVPDLRAINPAQVGKYTMDFLSQYLSSSA